MSGTNGNGTGPHRPTLEELRRAYEEGIPQTLLSGLEVVMRPVKPDALLLAGNLPDILTPVVLEMISPKPRAQDDTVFPDEAELEDSNPVSVYLQKERQRADEVAEYIRSIDVVCRAALLEPDIVPYLSLADRMWIFRLAFLPAEALRNFRLEPSPDVAGVPDEQGQVLAEPASAGS